MKTTIIIPNILHSLLVIFLITLLTLLTQQAFAVEVRGLYTASVYVKSQSSTERTEGFKSAIEKVLIKASGQKTLIEEAKLISELSSPDSYVLSYTYKDNPEYVLFIDAIERQKQREQSGDAALAQAGVLDNNSGELPDGLVSGNEEGASNFQAVTGKSRIQDPALPDTLTETSGVELDLLSAEQIADLKIIEKSPLPYVLDVTLSKQRINAFLSKFNIPLWGSSRPLTIIWLVYDENGSRTLVGAADVDRYLPGIIEKSEQLGLPIYLPVADLEDQMQADTNLLWGLYEEGLPSQDNKYQFDASVILTLSSHLSEAQQSDTAVVESSEDKLAGHDFGSSKQGLVIYNARWVLSASEQNDFLITEQQEFQSTDIEELTHTFLSDVARHLSQKYAVSSNLAAEDEIELIIDGVNSFENFKSIEEYISNLAPVSEFKLVKMRGESLYFKVKVLEGVDKLQQHIDLSGRLIRISPQNSINALSQDNLGSPLENDYNGVHYRWQ